MIMLLSGLPEIIGTDEDLARFLVHRNHFNVQGAKPAAFLPNPKDQTTSVFRHDAEPIDQLKDCGSDVGLNIYGAAIIKASDVIKIALTIESSEPPPRHAEIRGWPRDNDQDMQKAKQKEKAMLLASVAITHIF